MAYQPPYMTGSEHSQARSDHAHPRTYNHWQGGPMQSTSTAFSDPFGQQHQQPPDLNLDTDLSGSFDHHYSDAARTPTPYTQEPIRHWVTGDEPWSGVAHQTPRIDTTVGQAPQQPSAFAVPRSPARSASTASAMGPPQIDSAYCSNPSPSTNEPTTAGSDCQEVTVLFNNMGRYPFGHPSDMASTPSRGGSRRGAPSVHSNTDEHIMTIPEDGKCTFCQKEFRLKSELKKHVLRHTRPFRCTIQSCNGYVEGFTTSNDLDRHNRSVHNIFPKGAKVYICAAKNCAEGEKTWPRYDNFKQHCERMHKQDDLDTLIRRSERQAPTAADHAAQFSEYTRKPGAGRKRSVVSDTASMPPREASGGYHSQSEAFYSYPMSDTASWSGYNGGAFSDQSENTPGINVARRHIQSMRGPRMSRGENASVSSGRAAFSRNRGNAPPIVIHQANESQRQQRQEHQLAGMHLDSAPVESPVDYFDSSQQRARAASAGTLLSPNVARSPSLSSHSSVSTPTRASRGRANTTSSIDTSRSAVAKRKQEGAASNPKRVRCEYPGCGKADMRPCELKKHERRHSRPFGCTFDCCHKAFGSKNDWKRHESSQHFQDEMWRCAQPYAPAQTPLASNGVLTLSQSDCETATPCALVFYSEAELAAHLHHQHSIVDSDEIRSLCDVQRIGRNLCGSFWCGFCKEVLKLENEGRKGWDERFDHIGQHFHPEGRKIGDWVPPIGNKNKAQMLEEKQAKREWSDNSDIDADGDEEGLSRHMSRPEVIVSPVDVGTDAGDIAPFPSPHSSFDTTMSGIEFAGMGASDMNIDAASFASSLSTADSNMIGGQPAQSILTNYTNTNGQLPSPAASGTNDACSKRKRLGSPEDTKFCCQCGDGPLDMGFNRGLPCLTCGHSCAGRCES